MSSSIPQVPTIQDPTLSFTREEFHALVIEEEFQMIIKLGPLLNHNPLRLLGLALIHSLEIDAMVTELCTKKTDFLAFAIADVGNIFIQTLSGCLLEDGTLDKDKISHLSNEFLEDMPQFQETLADNGMYSEVIFFPDGEMALHTEPLEDEEARAGPELLTHEEAVNFASVLEQVDVNSIAPDGMRCSHCWVDFDDATNPANNKPVRLPCGHLLGFDCLVASLEQVGPLRGYCRQDIVALAAQAPQPN